MTEQATLESLLDRIRTLLSGDLSSHEGRDSLTLWITPGDDTLRTLLTAKGGKFSLVIREIPAILAEELSQPPFQENVTADEEMCFFAPPG